MPHPTVLFSPMFPPSSLLSGDAHLVRRSFLCKFFIDLPASSRPAVYEYKSNSHCMAPNKPGNKELRSPVHRRFSSLCSSFFSFCLSSSASASPPPPLPRLALLPCSVMRITGFLSPQYNSIYPYACRPVLPRPALKLRRIFPEAACITLNFSLEVLQNRKNK